LGAALLSGAAAGAAAAHEIHGTRSAADQPAFDIVRAAATTDGRLASFMMEVAGQAGASQPTPIGKLAGAKVEAYVWPTGLDPSAAGFERGSGVLALAVTAHPDFDDTPLFDENGDGD